MHHLTCGISSLLHSVDLIVFTVLLVYLILRISPHHSHPLCSHNLSLPRSFTPDLKLISFTDPLINSHSYSFRTAFMDLNLYCIKGGTGVVCFSFFFWLRVLDKAVYSAFESTLNSLSYRIVSIAGTGQTEGQSVTLNAASNCRQHSKPHRSSMRWLPSEVSRYCLQLLKGTLTIFLRQKFTVL